MERAETSTGLGREGGALWYDNLDINRGWMEKMVHERQVCAVVVHDTVNWLLV